MADFLCEIFNRALKVGTFPSCMKLASVTRVYKKGSRSDQGNSRLLSMLSSLSKVFERYLYEQMSKYFDKLLSKYQLF